MVVESGNNTRDPQFSPLLTKQRDRCRNDFSPAGQPGEPVLQPVNFLIQVATQGIRSSNHPHPQNSATNVVVCELLDSGLTAVNLSIPVDLTAEFILNVTDAVQLVTGFKTQATVTYALPSGSCDTLW